MNNKEYPVSSFNIVVMSALNTDWYNSTFETKLGNMQKKLKYNPRQNTVFVVWSHYLSLSKKR